MVPTGNNPPTVYPMGIFPAAKNLTPQSEQSSSLVMGKVVRIRPNIYVFVCDYCQAEHKSIDSFLRHTESHFQREKTNTPRSRATTQVHSNCLPPAELSQSTANTNGRGHIPFNGYTPIPYESNTEQSSQSPTIDITSSPSRESEDYIEEVYEIIDLGYDLDGNKYPMAEKAPVVSTKNGDGDKPKLKYVEKNISCLFCPKKYAAMRSLRRHKDQAHTDILKKLITLKKSFKCSICNEKFPRTSKPDAEKHLATHFKGSATKKSPKK